MNALSCIDQCFIADSMLDELPTPSRVGTTKVGGIDLNKPRMRWVVEAVIALCLSLSPQGFTASELARQVRRLGNQAEGQYDAAKNAGGVRILSKGSLAINCRDRVAALFTGEKALPWVLAPGERAHASRHWRQVT